MALLVGKALVNIVRARITTEETTPVIHNFETASEAKVEPEVSEGQETPLRVKNTIHAIDRTEDIVMGYNTTLKDNVFHPEVFALIDGGALRYETPGDDLTPVVGYDAPAAGQAVARTKFTLDLFTEEKDSSGDVIGYAQFTFAHCKGKPMGFEVVDGSFQVPELMMNSRPANGESPVAIEFLDALPAL